MFSGNIRTTFREIIYKSNRYMNSFFPDASLNIFMNIFQYKEVPSIGILNNDIFMNIFQYKEVPSIGILNNDILSLIRPESESFFKIHDNVGLRYIS